MNHSDVQEIIENIENDLEVENLNYKDVNVWPLLKFHLFWKLYKFDKEEYANRNKNKAVKANSKLNLYQRFSFHLHHIISLLINFTNNSYYLVKFKINYKKIDYLFVDTADNLYLDKENNKKISKYIFPYIEFLSKKGKTITINTLNSKIPNTERFFPVTFFNSDFYFKYLEIITFYKRKIKKQIDFKVSNFSSFTNYFANKPYHSIISEKIIIMEMEKIIVYEKFWNKILKHSQPKIVFLECYYGLNSNYGLFLAASKLNIKTVDVQHGVALGVFYTGWQKTIKTNSILPSYYWCWSKYDELFVNTTRKNSSNFKAITGGNLWLKKCIEQNNNNDGNYFIEQLIKEHKPSHVILVTLQHSIPISQLLIDAVQNSPLNYLWLIRFHPFDSVDPNYRSTYVNAFKDCLNVEYKNSTTSNLYTLLSKINTHVTHHSNVAVEAITFKVPTILLGNVFETIYKDYIEAGHFFVANDAKQILSYISSEISINETNFNLFKMQTEESFSNLSLEKIID